MKYFIFILGLLMVSCAGTTATKKEPVPIRVTFSINKQELMKNLIAILTEEGFAISQANEALGTITTEYRELNEDEKFNNILVKGIPVYGKVSISLLERPRNQIELIMTPIIKYTYMGEETITKISEKHPFYKKCVTIISLLSQPISINPTPK